MWWKRIGSLFSRRDSDDKGPVVKWIDGEENPWGIPILDVRQITLVSLSMSTELKYAENVDSMCSEVGTVFIGQPPKVAHTVQIKLRYPTDGFLADGILFRPQVMEHRWAIYYYQQQIIFVKVWTREVVAVASTQFDNGDLLITEFRGVLIEEDTSSAFTARVLDYLLRSHAMNLDFPAPLPDGVERNPIEAGNWCFRQYGNQALYATQHEIPPRRPEKLLRTSSLLHVAVADGDRGAIDAQLAAGVPIDVRSQDGMTPLHWSVMQDDLSIAEYLIERGCPVDIRSPDGATPMMVAVQAKRTEQVSHLLDHGADVNAASNKGFTSLHRSAELGDIELVRLLLDRGANPRVEVDGHTPRSLAELRGNTEIVRILDAL